MPLWPENDGINILSTPLGSPTCVEEYLNKKLVKHNSLLFFIVDASKMGFPRKTHKMLTGSFVPRLTHILKSVPKDTASKEWMHSADEAHLSTWLSCSKSFTLCPIGHLCRRHLTSPPPARRYRSSIPYPCCRRRTPGFMGFDHFRSYLLF